MEEEKKAYGLQDGDYVSPQELDELKAIIAERKRKTIERRKRAKRRLYIFACLFVVLTASFIFSLTPFFDIDSIEVSGNSYFTAEEIRNMAHATYDRNIIYNPGKHKIVKYLEENSYIKKASVRRHLPSTLVIEVEERAPIASIRYDKDYLIIDSEGTLLDRTKSSPDLTILEGVVINKMEISEKLGVEDEELLKQALDLLSVMKKKDLYFVSIDMSKMYIRANVYDSLVVKGTYQQLKKAMENDELHLVLEKLFEKGVKRGTITFSDEDYASFVPTL